MDIQSAPIFLLSFTAMAAFVAIAFACRAFLDTPVRAIVFNVTTSVGDVVCSALVLCFPRSYTRHAAKMVRAMRGLVRGAMESLTAYGTNNGDLSALPVRVKASASLAVLRCAKPLRYAQDARTLLATAERRGSLHTVRLDMEGAPANGAYNSDHWFVSLIKTPDVWRRGKLASGSSCSGRLMTPLLAPLLLYHDWHNSVINDACAYADSRVSPRRSDATRGGDRRATATSFNRNIHGGFS